MSDQAFDSLQEAIEAGVIGVKEKKQGQDIRVTTAKDVKPKQPERKPQPIALTYKYTGTCQECRTPVETIELDVPGKKTKVFVVAWCPMCKEAKNQEELTRLGE